MNSKKKKLWSSTYFDNVFSYTSCNYKAEDTVKNNLTLYAINELARKNRLILCRRQISNLDVRILIENQNTKNNNNEKSYEKFLYNFNKLSIACYLTALQANQAIWSLYNIPLNLAKDANFYVIESSPAINERSLKRTLSDNEFLKNYMEVIDNLHTSVSNSLDKNLNRYLPINYEFTDKSPSKEVHVFRSFRLLGLRHRINKSETTFTKLEPFNEIIEIRCAFDIKQFHNRSSYDCFIECEISYYKILPENLTINELTWFNYLNDFDTSDTVCNKLSDYERQYSDRFSILENIDEDYENCNY